MVEAMVDYMLGPFGNMLSELYLENQFIVNTIVVIIAVISLFKNRSQQVNN
ncbi:hypothetical protein [Thalassobacillus sp. CUG 92003]|uniref:hypothetical protein n=1 Tax=Thalassobacillus sp. CUG 92003 TaxID=2736641 RepID=UPI0015E7444E|nr:hypothetical protein [Thalassobacillus sp. CUG 92003]